MSPQQFEPSPPCDVDCAAESGGWTLVMVRELRHSPRKVWAALTDPEQLAAWAPYTADRDLGSTGAATLTMIDGETPQDLASTVRRAEPPWLLEYVWGTDLLRWELAETATGTRLTLRHTVEDREWVPKVAAGWHLCLDVAEHVLAGEPVEPIRGAGALDHGWGRLNDAYAEKLGIPNTGAPEL
ncbi:uncharacterized protein YndB with AHSA1/START domain [Saccharopolyspora erythraea NRRL 2338]|uniref:Activator of HSP90 ATPase 1 family protein n=2 Tax=Saccharopolyspora erythraea TaxID=1836 RepID=A4FG76_SACEN|nr:SRPBCC family protein [Saccharopolyspora erythraea]EQD81695.1 ATPase [Saccharopolyspora erythraea D]PFG96756.1 uncharacterized protein YndB with AHSA1/START domain [Saccharopolyspora erythraea NRRL 2338]QRK87005.1 SRPBCC family protein [Saccharopolyspora erythraea]CAM03051.1 activator of HSP90 ATPase 1 family protein [Saccharopolyspora erythraea NRRL 2338]